MYVVYTSSPWHFSEIGTLRIVHRVFLWSVESYYLRWPVLRCSSLARTEGIHIQQPYFVYSYTEYFAFIQYPAGMTPFMKQTKQQQQQRHNLAAKYEKHLLSVSMSLPYEYRVRIIRDGCEYRLLQRGIIMFSQHSTLTHSGNQR